MTLTARPRNGFGSQVIFWDVSFCGKLSGIKTQYIGVIAFSIILPLSPTTPANNSNKCVCQTTAHSRSINQVGRSINQAGRSINQAVRLLYPPTSSTTSQAAGPAEPRDYIPSHTDPPLWDAMYQGFTTGGPRPPGGPRRHCRGSATQTYFDQSTIDFYLFIFY